MLHTFVNFIVFPKRKFNSENVKKIHNRNSSGLYQNASLTKTHKTMKTNLYVHISSCIRARVRELDLRHSLYGSSPKHFYWKHICKLGGKLHDFISICSRDKNSARVVWITLYKFFISNYNTHLRSTKLSIEYF
jgi:hypothetical protein